MKILLNNLNVEDKSLIFNTDLVEALELHNLMAQSKVTLHSALHLEQKAEEPMLEKIIKKEMIKNGLCIHLVWLDNNGTSYNGNTKS